jgi:hypothetical protein
MFTGTCNIGLSQLKEPLDYEALQLLNHPNKLLVSKMS